MTKSPGPCVAQNLQNKRTVFMRSVLGRVRMQLGREQIILVSLAVVYVIAGKIGLAFGYVHDASSALFPPA